MLLDEQANKYRALDQWFQVPQGRRVAQAFTRELTQLNEQLSGQNLLQLGSCGDNLWLSALNFRRKFLVSPCVLPQKTALISSLSSLPLERDSIDCVVAPLTLEAFAGTKNPLNEIDRVLKPMGYTVFFGINPFSFWGAALRLRRINCFGPVSTTLTSSLTLRRAMLSRGYRQCVFTSFYYILPVANENLIKKLEVFNEVGKMVWPFPAGFYCYIAQKYQSISPPLLAEVSNNEISVQKSTLQATGKWIHE